MTGPGLVAIGARSWIQLGPGLGWVARLCWQVDWQAELLGWLGWAWPVDWLAELVVSWLGWDGWAGLLWLGWLDGVARLGRLAWLAGCGWLGSGVGGWLGQGGLGGLGGCCQHRIFGLPLPPVPPLTF